MVDLLPSAQRINKNNLKSLERERKIVVTCPYNKREKLLIAFGFWLLLFQKTNIKWIRGNCFIVKKPPLNDLSPNKYELY
jgi:hypothetical protein